MKPTITLFCLFIGMTAVPRALASGGVDSGGVDSHAIDHNAAWFLGINAIQYCFASSLEFEVDVPTAKMAFEAAASKWRQYIELRNVNTDREPNMKLILNLEFLDACNGKEDLKIYLGLEDEVVKAAKTKFDRPVALAHRTHFDPTHGWGRGIFWVGKSSDFVDSNFSSIDWTKPGTLEAIFLHELGHMLGCEHTDGTVMDDRQLLILLPWKKYYDEKPESAAYRLRKITSIDSERQLFMNQESPSFLNWLQGTTKYKTFPETFKRFVGRYPVGNPSTRARIDMVQPDNVRPKLIVEFSDAQGTTTVNVSLIRGDNIGVRPHGRAKIFKSVRVQPGDEENEPLELEDSAYSYGLAGMATVSANETSYQALFSLNLDESQMTIQYAVGDVGTILFTTED